MKGVFYIKRIRIALLAMLLALGMAACAAPASQVAPSATGEASDIVTFSDPVLEALVRAGMGKPQGSITVAEAEAVTRLSLSFEWERYTSEETPIKDLGGLEHFTNLETLDLSEHAVTDITPLAGLYKLTTLILGGNPVTDIAPLAGLTNLKVLALSGCAAEDYSPLAKLVSLHYLSLDHAAITDVSPLTALTSLRHLYLAGCAVDYTPLAEFYPNLEGKDFHMASTLAELGFIMDDGGKQAIYDGEHASVRINRLRWGAPPSDWMKDCVRTVFQRSGYKIDIGYYPNSDAYVMMAYKDGNQAVNYVYDHAKDSFTFGVGDRNSAEQAVRGMFTHPDADDVLLTPVRTFGDLLAEALGVSADALFLMPFDEADGTGLSPYERLGFTMLDYKGTCFYGEQTPHELSISVHRPQWDENAPAENRVDWSMEFYDGDVNGYKLLMLYYEADGKYHISIEKDGAEAGFETFPATGEKGWEYPDLETAHRMFNDAFKTTGKELYDKVPAYFEQAVQKRFGMSIGELYALPMGD